MGMAKALRMLAAEARRAEREEQRRRRELLKQQKQMERMETLQRAAYEVDLYENHIDTLLSVHKECSQVWDWQAVKVIAPLSKPVYLDEGERFARIELEQYSPSFFDKALMRKKKKRDTLAKKVEWAKAEDVKRYQDAIQQFEKELSEWQSLQKIASGILANEPSAYIEAIGEIDPLTDIKELGSSIKFYTNDTLYMEAILYVSEQSIPSEVKSLLQSGKLSVKKMSKGQFCELYQDHVCSCVLRIARELFAILPIQMVFVHATSKLLNMQTGYKEQQPILSVAIPRQTLIGLNFEMIDCSESMNNFVHRIKFSKTKGFSPVEKLKPQDLILRNNPN